MRTRPSTVLLREARGFSLLEVLVAFTILALTLSVILEVFGNGLRSVRIAESHSRAALLAQSQLAMLSADNRLKEGVESGEFDENFRWRTTVAPYDAQALGRGAQGRVQLLAVTVEVFWDEGKRRRDVSLNTLRPVPAR